MADACMAPPGRSSSMRSTTAAPNSNASSGAVATSSDGAKGSQITNPRPETKQLLEKPGNEYCGYIRSEKDLEEFEEAMTLLNAGKDRSHMVADYPKTEDKYAMCVHALFDAIKNLAGIDEASAKDGIAVRFIKPKKSFEIELVAAKLMRAMRLAQLGRIPLDGKTMQEYNCFRLRFFAVLGALKMSKLLVKSAFEGDEWINRIALNPVAELQRKRLNKEVNDMKKQRIAAKMEKQDPNLNFKTAAKTAAATKRPAPTATPSPTAQAQQPSKRAKTSHDQPMLQLAQAVDEKMAIVHDPDPMNAPGPVRDYDSEFDGKRHAVDAPQSRNSLAGPDAPGASQTEEAEDAEERRKLCSVS